MQMQKVTAFERQDDQRECEERCENDQNKSNHQRKEEIAVTLFPKFAPRLGNHGAVFYEAVDKHESPACS